MDAKCFVPPPSTLPVEFQFDFHLSHNSDHPVFIHPRSDGTIKTYTYADITPAIHRYASVLLSSISVDQGSAPIIAFITTSANLKDAFTYSLAIMGVLRAGMTAFPISPRFSPEIIAHIINDVKPTHVLVNLERKEAVDQIMALVNPEHRPSVFPMPSYHNIIRGDFYEIPNKHQRSVDEPALIIHSSGSTSRYPKTIKWTSNFYLNNAQTIEFSPIVFAGKIFGLQGLEPFHSFGLCCLSWMTRVGFVMALLDPEDTASLIPASFTTIYNSYKQILPSITYLGANSLEVWSQDSEKMHLLQTMLVMTGGRVLNKKCAKRLLDNDVRLTLGYGSTESGSITVFNSLGMRDWDYFCPSIAEVNFVRREDGLFSLIVMSTSSRQLPVYNATYKGSPGYDTGDLFREHTTKPGYFSVVGRLGDQIMLSSGEMVNPEEIERIICQWPQVENAMLFGSGRPSIGVIIQSVDGFDIEVEKLRVAFLNYLEALIETAFRGQPSFTHISKEMIILTNNKKPIPQATKGMPIRVLALEQFENEIHTLYTA
ncbi:MAG: hypothetical protein NXY57DRAFT_1064096 [Lentinula lateritia]|nr:MAG: hypothetical protein NXY57DRAFT_1064096 [Lentinula lateritia]